MPAATTKAPAKTGAAAKKAPAKRAPAKPKAPEHPLMHLVPPKEKADGYISRVIRGHNDVNLLRYAREQNKHVLMSGPTGLGKSHCVEAYCAADNIPLVVIEAKDGIDPNTFFGGYVPKKEAEIQRITALIAEVTDAMPKGTDPSTIMQIVMGIVGAGSFEWVYSDVVEVMRHGGVLFVDECNFMRPRVSATFHRVMREGKFSILERGNETIVCHPKLQIVAAYNDGYEGTYPLNQAFRNRFAIKLELDYDEDVERPLLCMPVMLELASKLRVSDAGIESPVSTNMLFEFEELAIDLGLDFAIDNFLASFSADEKQAVKEVITLLQPRLQGELAKMEELDNS